MKNFLEKNEFLPCGEKDLLLTVLSGLFFSCS
nr:MAG TPA: hypothetical protein [Caudoviricetes sp.]